MTIDVAESVAAADDDVGSGHYRYPGSPPFRDTELDRRLFRGRAQEADIVLHSILSTNLFLLYAESGLGKTSLLNAGVMHELRARAHWPVSVRLNDPSISPVQCIRELIDAAAASDPDVDLVIQPDGTSRDDETLWDLLTAMEVWRGNELQQPVVILDQFEELFTLDWDDDVRSRFIEQFGEVVRGHRADAFAGIDAAPPEVKFVLVIREDALGELDALSADVPQVMRSRFRLGPLDPVQAEAAVLEPAQLDDARLASQRFEYTEAAAREILEFLRTEKQRGSTRLATAVDPSQLQIVCQYVEQAILPDKVAALGPDEVARIDAPDLGGREGLDQILSDFYRRTIESLPTSAQRSARHLCEDGLINRSGRRLSLEQDEIAAGYAVGPATLQALVDGRLLRADPRVGSVYYELSHDTLVGPIRAYSDEQRALQRRRRRRVFGIAAGVVAVVAAGIAIAIAASSGSSDSAIEPAIDLAVGDTDVEGAIEEPGAVVRYAVDADATDPLVVVVEPEPGLNAVIDVTTLNDARVTRQVDQYTGGAERMVIPPVPEGEPGQEIRVTSFDSTLGSFAVSVEKIEAVELTSEDDERAGSLSGPESLGVFSVETSPDIVSTVAVTPASIPAASAQAAGDAVEGPGSSGEQKALDVELEVIGPTGVGRRFDEAGPRQAESVTLGEPAGVHYVVVRGKDGTTGSYAVELESAELTMSGELVVDESVRGVISSADEPAEFTFAPPDDGSFSIEVVPDRQFDAIIEIESGDGAGSGADAGGNGQREGVFVDGASGPYVVRVSGWEGSTGGFEITVGELEVSPIGIGEQRVGSGEGVFDVDVVDGALLALTVQPTSGGFADIEVTDPDGQTIGFASSTGPQGEAVATIEGPSGTYRAVVRVNDGGGDFTVSLSTLETEPLTTGESVQGSGLAAYTVEVDGGLLELVVEPASSADVIEVEVRDPAGFSTGFGYADGGRAAVVPIGPLVGTHAVVIRSGDGAFTASLAPLEAQRLAVGDVVGAAGTAAFEVEVDDGEFYQLTVDPGSIDDFVEVEVRDPDGVPIAFGYGAQGGEPAVATFGGRAGTYVLFARADASAEFTTALAPLDAQPLAPGDTVTVGRNTVLSVDARAGETYELTVEPVSPDAYIEIELLDADGLPLLSDANVDAGETLEASAVAPADGTYYLVVRSFEGDGQVIVSLATDGP